MRLVGLRGSGVVAALLASLVASACDSGAGDAIFSGGGEAGQGVHRGGADGGDGDGDEGAGTNAGSGVPGGGDSSGAGVGGMPGSAGASEGGAEASSGGGGQLNLAGQPGQAGQGGAGPVCDRILLSVEPRVSQVMFLVDRSGTMFKDEGQPWHALRDAALPVIDAFDQEMDIGFLAMTGEAGDCPLFDEVAPGPANHSAIAAKYGALAAPLKGESPHMLALERAADLLDAAPGTGERFALLVIDGPSDWCSDGARVCPIDSMVGKIQSLYARQITTLVASLPLLSVDQGEAADYAAALQSYANAGLNRPATIVGPSVANVYYQCQGDASWSAEFALTGKPATQAIGSYASLAGDAPYTSLDPASEGALTSALTSLFSRTKSCLFDIQDHLVNHNLASSGVVKLDGQTVPFGTSGWQLADSQTIELVGSACAAWQAPGAKPISVDFPCSALIE